MSSYAYESTSVRNVDNMENKEYLFKIFLSGRTPGNWWLFENIKNILDDKVKNRYVLKIIYIDEDPDAVECENIICTPTIIRHLPLPQKRFIGYLNDKDIVRVVLSFFNS
jgi:circadian clock protein KaiB